MWLPRPRFADALQTGVPSGRKDAEQRKKYKPRHRHIQTHGPFRVAGKKEKELEGLHDTKPSPDTGQRAGQTHPAPIQRCSPHFGALGRVLLKTDLRTCHVCE